MADAEGGEVSFFTTRDVKATRKPHQCEGCGKLIEAAAPAWYFSLLQDGEFCAGYYHPDCRAAEVELNDLQGNYGGEDWTALSLIPEEPEDKAWLIEAHPVVAARMGLTGGAA